MRMRGDKCYPDRGKWVKIPLLPENVDKRSPSRPWDPREGNDSGGGGGVKQSF